jgi:predicted nucleic acid-binding protein
MARRRRGRPFLVAPGVVVLDSGAITACVRPGVARHQLLALLTAGWVPLVPAAVLAEALTGKPGPDARANQLLASLGDDGIGTCTESVGRKAAALRRPALRRATPSGVDAIVAAHAADATPSAVVMTDDPDDLEALVTGLERVEVLRVSQPSRTAPASR